MKKIRIGVIPAGGMGVRAYPKTTYIPKPMFEVGGKPVILRNIEIMRDKLGIKEIYIITGYKGNLIQNFLGDGSRFRVHIKYIHCKDPSIGLAKGLLLVKNYVKEDFVTILGDEMYINSNHEIIKKVQEDSFSAICCLMHSEDSKMISKNYTVKLRGNRISALEEKPVKTETDILGCGTYIFTTDIFEAIEKTKPSRKSGRIELTDAINTLVLQNKKVYGLFLEGIYQNINSVEDHNYANYLYRSKFFNNYKISIIIPAYNEEESIGHVIKDFGNKANEIFVIDNSSCDKTREEALKAGAVVERVHLKGYGDTIKYGLNNAKGDILIIMEADHSFRSKDIGKILEYLKDADMVIGTRTTRQMIEQGSNMDWFLRWGNVFLGKLIEVLWWNQEPRFTDVGCTFRGIWKDSYIKIKDNFHASGPEFSPEMMIEALKAHLRVIEIPVSYYKRMGGKSKHSAGFKKIKTGLKMLNLILGKKFGWKA